MFIVLRQAGLRSQTAFQFSHFSQFHKLKSRRAGHRVVSSHYFASSPSARLSLRSPSYNMLNLDFVQFDHFHEIRISRSGVVHKLLGHLNNAC